jgi:hypothetical protein
MKIIELFLPEDSDEGGIDMISLVDRPAHNSNFLTFSTDLPNLPEENLTYIADNFDADTQIELANIINSIGEPVGKLEKEGYEIFSIELADLNDFLKEKEKFIQATPNERSAEDTPRELIRYKYMLGPGFSNPIIPTSREFCIEMINANKVFRVEDIIAMTEDCANEQFGCYNIMTWRGSFNCRHLWYKMRYRGGRGPRAGIEYPIGERTNPSWAQPSTQVNMAEAILGKDFLTRENFGVLGVIDGQPLFTNKEDALKLAEIIGCSGYHEYTIGDFKGFMACQTHEFASYDDYPQEASENACRVLKWIDEHGRDEVSGMEQTGLARANQLCKREPISQDTIARMASFERHRKNSEISPEFKGTPWKDKGYVAWLAWGGDAGVKWASRKLEQLKTDMLDENPCQTGYIAYGTKEKNGRQVPNCIPKDGMSRGSISGIGNDGGCCYDEDANLNILGYKTRFFHICPVAIEIFTDLLKTDNLGEDVAGMIRSAALQADRIFEIEEKVVRTKTAEFDEYTEALLLMDDFVDLMAEIAVITGKEYNMDFMLNHMEIIGSYLPQEMDIDVSGLSPYTDQGTTGKTKNNSFKMEFSYDEEKMEITGAAIIPNKMIIRKNPITEELYYVFFSEKTTKNLMELFAKNSKMDATNLNHSDIAAEGTYIVESWLVNDPQYDKIKTLGLDFPKGTWVITMKVDNKDLWSKIKQGEYNGFSVEGWFNERVVFN